MSSVIYFASIDSCPHCVRAKNELEDLISLGKVLIVSPEKGKQLGMNENGYPQFKFGNKTTVGFKNKEHLMKMLNVNHNDKNSKIIFFNMEGCGFCKKAKDMLNSHIQNGDIVLKPHTEADSHCSGFPCFENSNTGKKHLGLPSSYEELLTNLDIVENYHHYRENKRVKLAPQYRETFQYGNGGTGII
jgi:glutaredoxin